MFKAVNREHWLSEATELMRPWFRDKGRPLPDRIQVSCGFPKGRGDMSIGQCWYKSNTVKQEEAVEQLFICPTQDQPVRVLDILLHENCHVACGPECGHKGPFRALAKDFGLEGKMTATVCNPGTPLHDQLSQLASHLGPYPHAALALRRGMGAKQSKWIRLMSPEDEAYTLVISRNSLERAGYPQDPWGNEMVTKE